MEIIRKIKELMNIEPEWFVLYDKLRTNTPEDELSWSNPMHFKEALTYLNTFPDAVLIHRKRDGKIQWKRSVIGRDRYKRVL